MKEKIKSKCCNAPLEMKCAVGMCRYACIECDKTHEELDENFNPIN